MNIGHQTGILPDTCLLYTSGKIGKFQLANHGTLFLDEIGDLPLPLQVKLLRVLQEHEIEKVGGTKPIPVDVRIIAATRKNLQQMMEEGTFRADLYYRLAVVTIDTVPLRELSLIHILESSPTEELFSMPRDKRTEDYITGRCV